MNIEYAYDEGIEENRIFLMNKREYVVVEIGTDSEGKYIVWRGESGRIHAKMDYNYFVNCIAEGEIIVTNQYDYDLKTETELFGNNADVVAKYGGKHCA